MSDLTLQIRNCVLENQGIVPYIAAWNYQKFLVAERLENPALPDRLILLEHPEIYQSLGVSELWRYETA